MLDDYYFKEVQTGTPPATKITLCNLLNLQKEAYDTKVDEKLSQLAGNPEKNRKNIIESYCETDNIPWISVQSNTMRNYKGYEPLYIVSTSVFKNIFFKKISVQLNVNINTT